MSEEFILRAKAEDVLTEAVVASNGLVDDFAAFPVVEYICSAIFLKMTGLLEQKFRAAAWTMANNNRDYRYEFLRKKHSQCSRYDDKQSVYKDLIAEIFLLKYGEFEIDHRNIAQEAITFIQSLFQNTIFSSCLSADFLGFKKELNGNFFSKVKITANSATHVLITNSDIKNLFEEVIHGRNKIAHNLYVNKCVKNDLTELCVRKKINHNNIFIQFFVLLYIDRIFNYIYQIYSTEQDKL